MGILHCKMKRFCWLTTLSLEGMLVCGVRCSTLQSLNTKVSLATYALLLKYPSHNTLYQALLGSKSHCRRCNRRYKSFLAQMLQIQECNPLYFDALLGSPCANFGKVFVAFSTDICDYILDPSYLHRPFASLANVSVLPWEVLITNCYSKSTNPHVHIPRAYFSRLKSRSTCRTLVGGSCWGTAKRRVHSRVQARMRSPSCCIPKTCKRCARMVVEAQVSRHSPPRHTHIQIQTHIPWTMLPSALESAMSTSIYSCWESNLIYGPKTLLSGIHRILECMQEDFALHIWAVLAAATSASKIGQNGHASHIHNFWGHSFLSEKVILVVTSLPVEPFTSSQFPPNLCKTHRHDGEIWMYKCCAGEEKEEDIATSVNRLAELSLLGAGGPNASPQQDESHSAYQSEVQWRVVLWYCPAILQLIRE